MTREEAIEILKRIIAYESDFAEAKRMAIEALSEKHQLSAETPTNTPTIVRCGECDTNVTQTEQVTSKLESVEIPTIADDESTMGQPKSKLEPTKTYQNLTKPTDTDLIRRSDAVEAVHKAETKECAEWNIHDLPTADRPQIVKCKDCVHYRHEDDMGFCRSNSCYMNVDDFCSYGEEAGGTQP